MIRNLLATTAIATLLASGAVAQTTTAPTADPSATMPDQQQTPMTVRAEGHLASNLIGESVYNGTGEDAENIGDVNDLVVSQDGNIEAIVVGVGGFLGIGQKEVALEYGLVEWSEQQDGERWMVVETTADALKAQEEFDRSAYRPMPADAEVSETQPATADDLAAAPVEGEEGATDDSAMAPADDAGGTMAVAPTGGDAGDTTAAAPTDDQAGDETASAPAEESDTTAAAPADDADTTAAAPTDEQAAGGDETTMAQDREDRPTDDTAAATTEGGTDQTQTAAIDRSTLQEAGADQISAENLTGTTVYGADEEQIGEIGDVILTPEGEVDAVLVDVGGFLGIGEKEIAIGMDNLAFMTDENSDLYLYTEFTQEELEAQPEYDEATYAEQRDEMRLQAQ